MAGGPKDLGASDWPKNHKRIESMRNSLAVQWLGLCALAAEGLGSILVGDLKSHKPRGVA